MKRCLPRSRQQLDAGEKWIRSHFPKLPIEVQLIEGSAVEELVKASETC